MAGGVVFLVVTAVLTAALLAFSVAFFRDLHERGTTVGADDDGNAAGAPA